MSALPRRTLRAYTGPSCHRLACLDRDGRIPGWITPTLGHPSNRWGRGGATAIGGTGAPGLGTPRGPRCDYAHAHGSCPWEGTSLRPASDAGIGHVFRPCLPGRPYTAIHSPCGLLDGAPGALRSRWYAFAPG